MAGQHDFFVDILTVLGVQLIRGAFLRNASSIAIFFLPTLCPYGTRSIYFQDVQLKSRVNRPFKFLISDDVKVNCRFISMMYNSKVVLKDLFNFFFCNDAEVYSRFIFRMNIEP